MKYVIYKDSFGFKGTQEKNYRAQIPNKSEICDYSDFENAEEIKAYLLKYTYINERDIIIIN
jgi:hypothetical protein